MNKLGLGLAILAILSIGSNQAFATAYQLPPENQSVIGQIQYSSVVAGDTISGVAQRFDLGFNAVENANPQMERGFREGMTLQIPTKHLLPSLARRGIVINLPEMRMYYYPEGTGQVYTYPIGIGKLGKTIPILNTKITKKVENPTWVPPDDIREFNLEQGIVLPKIMPPGPDNPLGPYAIYMQLPTYLIHSTIFPQSVGKRASFGCIRMYETDIKDFFPSIVSGIPVAIINSPVKVGWQDDRLYMEAHEPLEEHSEAFDATLPGMVSIVDNVSSGQEALIDWQLVSYIDRERDGIPHEIGIRIH